MPSRLYPPEHRCEPSAWSSKYSVLSCKFKKKRNPRPTLTNRGWGTQSVLPIKWPGHLAGSQSAVETGEGVGQHERHDQDARAEDEHVLILAQIEAADATDEQVADGKVEEAP